MALVIVLRGPVLDLLRIPPATQNDYYHKLSAALVLHFGEQHLRHLLQVQLKTRKQKVGEILQDCNR